MSTLTRGYAALSENELATIVIEASIEIHKKWGPGLLESVYEALLVHYLLRRGLRIKNQVAIPFYEDTIRLDIGFKADVIIENKLLIELKSVEAIHPVHLKTALTYLRILDLHLALVINFGEAYLKDGIKRVINGNLS